MKSHPTSRKLTIEQAREIRRLRQGVKRCKHAKDKSCLVVRLAERFGVSPSTIVHVAIGKIYKEVV